MNYPSGSMNAKKKPATLPAASVPAPKPAFDPKRPISWSSISSFEWSKKEWYDKYILGLRRPASAEMLYGSKVGKRLSSHPKFLKQVPRLPVFEHELRTEFSKIPLIGYVDSMSEIGSSSVLDLLEYKTGKVSAAWTQKKADTHGQIDMYLLMIYLLYKIKPEQVRCRIVWLPTEERYQSMHDGEYTISLIEPVVPKIFHTKRTMADVLRFGSRIKKRVREMEEFSRNYK